MSPPPPLRGWTPRHAAWALFLIPAWFMLWSARDMWLTYSPTPFNDQWINVFWWREAPKAGWLKYLFSQHNEHRILFPRLVFLADWKWFQGRNGLNLVVIGLIQLAGAAFFLKVAEPRRRDGLGLVALAAALALVFSLVQYENLFWGFQVQFVGVYAAGAWGLYLFCLGSEKTTEARWGVLVGAMALLVLATFSMANGAFAGLAMVAVGILTRRRAAAVAVAAVLTTVLLGVYLHGYHRVAFHSPPALALQHPGRYVTYIAVFLGAIWAPGRVPAAALIGLVGFAATAAMLPVVLRKEGRDPARAALFGVVLFVGLSAASTSLGRLSFGIEQAMASRYTTPTAYFWASQALFWAITLQQGRRPRPLLRHDVTLALLGILAWLVVLQFVGDRAILGTRERVLSGSSALLGGVEDTDALLGLYPSLDTIHDLAPYMRRTHVALFADPPGVTVGAPFTRPVAPSTICRGFFDVLTPDPRHDGAWRAVGWGWDLKARRPFSRIALVDETGQALGVGLSGLPRPDVQKAVREVTRSNAGWIAALNRGSGRTVIAYGITAAGPACELGRKAWPQ